jgi:hypothetical protein
MFQRNILKNIAVRERERERERESERERERERDFGNRRRESYACIDGSTMEVEE